VLTNSIGEESEAEILGSDLYLDLAVLRVKKDFVTKVATLGSSENLNLGDIVFTIGTPLGKEYSGSVTKGIISGKDRMVEVDLSDQDLGIWIMKVIQTDASLNPGNSGGPLCNTSGEVIGINTLKYSEENIEGMGFAIPIEYVMAHIDVLESGKEIERPYLGLSLIDIDDSYSLLTNKIKVILEDLKKVM